MDNNSRTLNVILVLEAIIFLLPTTLLCLGGTVMAVALFFGGNKDTLTPFFLYIAIFLLIPGYGLFCLWWLLIRVNKVLVKNVPRHIWLGSIIGSLIALLFTSPYFISGLKPPTEFITWSDNFRNMILFGGGPLIMLLSIALVLWHKEKSNLTMRSK